MSRKISDFFIKKSIKIESIEKSENDNQSAKGEVLALINMEKEKYSQNLSSNNNSGKVNQSRINENVKSEAEAQLLVILQQQKIHKLPVPIKIEVNEPKVEKFQCKICNKSFGSLKLLKIHAKIHDKKFACQICDKKFPEKYRLLEHIRNIHENPKSFKCDICKVGFNAKGDLKGHQKVHIKNRPKPLKCSKCGYATDRQSKLTKHLKTHERIIERCDKCNTILYKNRIHDCQLGCKFCGKKFSHSSTVLNHIKKYHAHIIDRSFYECDICGFKVIRKNILVNHMKDKHVYGKIQTFTCDLDGKTFKIKAKLNQHMKSHLPLVKCDFCLKKVNIRNLKGHIKNLHTGIKPPKKQNIKNQLSKTKGFQCHICPKILSTKQHLNIHISSHNKTIKCKFCEKLFGCQSSLKKHVRNCHENWKEHVCDVCDKKFVHPFFLKNHLKIHDPNRARDLKCTQCDYATDRKSSLEAHLNFHIRIDARNAAIENPHKCPQCPAVKRSQKSLRMHITQVHPKVIFECDICGRKIKKVKGNLLFHFRKFHKIRP